ncbi:hypothetical protein GZH53_12205 [Flavihumibacter sp. R14]|nr:hypothetical protein [Flavihumibacter soli]
MKTVYIVVIIILLGASVFAYIYNQKTANESTKPSTQLSTQPGTPANATAAKGLNPAHGLPGHRCDLPVGAPLTVTQEQKTAAPAQPKTNPQHGMPGHRCDLAVGAPL